MANDSAMSIAPKPITLSDGSKWKMHRMRDIDLDELSNWVQAIVAQSGVLAARVGVDLTEEERESLRATALKLSLNQRWNGKIGRDLIVQPRGVVQILLLSSRQAGNESKLLELVQIPENLSLIFQTFRELNLAPPTKPEPEIEPKPEPASEATGK